MSQWQWKMGYCKKKGIPPAQKWAWDEAEKAYQHLGPEVEDGPEFAGWEERSHPAPAFTDRCE